MKRQLSQRNLTTVLLAANLITMWLFNSLYKKLRRASQDKNFLHGLESLEGVVSKILSVGMIIVIFVSLWNLGIFLFQELLTTPPENFGATLFKTFGLFLNVLIALEILENITAYLKKHVIQVELVIVTSVIAVARKIIILDLEKIEGIQIIGLAFTIIALSISYWIVRSQNAKKYD
ncbi:MAG: phosphate-starvation-inducible PsiE family protein [Microcoleus vaginatus WJT46-NPBG5]|nr:phosphate-starvation-inducible PsiE family protein [Microcoleus vaginatus WJT46-NPBG5]